MIAEHNTEVQGVAVMGPRPCLVLGVTGSIAAFKAAALTSALAKAGVEVHVIMTAAATKLVQPQTFFTLSRNPVVTDLWSVPEWEPEHIALAERSALLAVAPATANFLAKLAHGLADDALSSYAVSHTGPVLVAPAMNPRMWRQPVVQENCRILRERGVIFIGPDTGAVACGGEGTGRFADPAVIQQAILARLAVRSLPRAPRCRIVVTAGPTREALDPVRYLTNRSSGKMGYALAAVAAAAGHEVVLISGPVTLPAPALCRVIAVETAAEMSAAVKREFAAADLLLMAAAVADYRPVAPRSQKLKKRGEILSLELEPTEDILATVAATKKPGQKILGFAAETEHVEVAARDKLVRKNLDWIAANDVSRRDIGFDAEQNEVMVFSSAAGAVRFPIMPKLELAARLLELVLNG